MSKKNIETVIEDIKEIGAWKDLKEIILNLEEVNEENVKEELYKEEGSGTGETVFNLLEGYLPDIEEHIYNDNNKVKNTREWDFKNILPEEHFISQYLELANGLTDAYPEYHFASALSLLSVAADRKVKIKITPTEMYPNFWSLLIGYSTVSRKSTAMKISRSILSMADMEQKKLPQDFSPEALIEYLGDYPKSFFMRDEFGDFLAKMNRSYQSGMDALLSRLYDCPDHYKKKLRKETFELENLYITFLGACVPKQIARNSKVDDLESGFFPRIAFVWPERKKERKPRRSPTHEETKKQELLGEWLSGVHRAINQMYQNNDKKEISFKLSEKALEEYNNWCEEYENFIMNTEKGKEFSAFFGRISDMVLKISTLIELGSSEMLNVISTISSISNISSVSTISKSISGNAYKGTKLTNSTNSKRNQGKSNSKDKKLSEFVVSRSSIQVAIYYAVKLFLPNARKIMKYVQAYQDEDKLQKVYELAIKYSDEEGKVTHSELLRYSNMKSSDFNDYVKTLYTANMIDIEKTEKGGKVYYPLDPDSDSALPDFSAPEMVSLGVDMPEELDMKKEDIIEEGERLENIKEKTKNKIKELSHSSDGANREELNKELKKEFGLDKKQTGDLYEMLLNDAEIMETDPNHIKLVK